MVKLIASDVDGTLVKDSSPYIYSEMPQAIKELKKKGIIFCVASGRQYYSIRSLFKEVADDIAYIAENGAHVVALSINHSADQHPIRLHLVECHIGLERHEVEAGEQTLIIQRSAGLWKVLFC